MARTALGVVLGAALITNFFIRGKRPTDRIRFPREPRPKKDPFAELLATLDLSVIN